MRRIGLAALLLLFALSGLSGCGGNPGSAGAGSDEADKLGLKYLTDDVFAAAVIHPGKIRKSELLSSISDEQIDIFLKSARFPLDPRDLDVGIVGVAPPSPGDEDPHPLVVGRFVSKQARDAAIEEGIGGRSDVKEHKGVKYFCERRDIEHRGAYFFPDDKTVVLSTEPRIKQIIEGKTGASPVVERLKKAGLEHEIVAAMVVEPVRDHAQEIMAKSSAGLPPNVSEMLKSLEGINAASLTVSLGEDPLVQISIDAKDKPAAESIAKSTKDGVAEGKKMMPFASLALVAALPQDEAGMKLGKLITQLMDGISAKADGATVEIVAKRPANFSDAPAIITSAIAVAEREAKKVEQRNRLRQVSWGIQDAAGYEKFPAAATYSKDGKPLLSWRVAILKEVGYSKLYDEFHHDEPWNSPHNLKLLEKMPEIYGGTYDEELDDDETKVLEPPTQNAENADDNSDDKPQPAQAVAADEGAKAPEGVGRTQVVVFVGPGSAFATTTGVEFGQVEDGLSGTLLGALAPADKAVPWTKPADLPFDPADPLAAFGGKLPREGLTVLFADGRVETLPPSTSAEDLKAMITIAGGEVVELPSEFR